ncbi:MAG: hypothetical protein ACHQQ3_11545 [Gemmatimonadales bacterium]
MRRRPLHPWLLSACVVLASCRMSAQAPSSLSDSAYAALVARISEPAGFFPSDNLITNEDSYLHPISTIKRLGVTGGAYLGVAPDQNFSYIAAVRPKIAIILDIRRDNVDELQMFKALFALARNRIEFLCLLFGQPAPSDTTGWGAKKLSALVDYLDKTPGDSATRARAGNRVMARVRTAGLRLLARDLDVVAKIHAAFMASGLDLRWSNANYYGGVGTGGNRPELRRLLLETDRSGVQSNYLAREDDFQFLKSLEERNLVIPVTGDFGGPHALGEIGKYLTEIHEKVSVFYTSNVEQYLWRDGSFFQFARSVSALPRDDKGMIVRSYFQMGRYAGPHPQWVQGYLSVQLMQRLERFAAVTAGGGFRDYTDLVMRELIEP